MTVPGGPPQPVEHPESRASTALLEAVLSSVSEGVAVVDSRGRFVLMNRAAHELLGIEQTSPETWTRHGRAFRPDGVTPFPENEQPTIRALVGVTSDEIDMVIRHPGRPDGVRITVSARPLAAAAGVPGGGAVAVFHDVTAARALQEQVTAERDRYERLREVLSDLGEGVAILQGQRFVFVNDAYAHLVGYSVPELLALDSARVAADADAVVEFAAIRAGLRGPTDADRRATVRFTRLRHRDGHVVPVETLGMTVNRAGTAQHVYVVRDLTEADRVRAELAERAVQMETANRDLAAARDVATAASRAKSAFLATMSHELRTPLNAVIGFTDLLLDSPLDADQREYLTAVHTGGDNLVTLINDILDWSKMESGALNLEQRSFNLRDCVEGAVDLLATAVGGKDVDLLVDLQPGCPEIVVGDSTRLRQILINLVGNAVKFTEQGHVLVTAAALPDTDAAGTDRLSLRFTVTDTGIGIAADQLGRLFRDFTQIDDSTTRTYGGTGLGLAISQRLAAAMDGAIAVTSTLGVGSTFTVDVRLTPASAGDLPDAAVVPGTLPGRRVLVVDDNPANRQILAAQLTGWGMQPDLAVSGPQALTALAAGSYDIGIFDFHMPGMDGLTLLQQAAALPAAAGMPVVMLTSISNRVTVMGAPHPPARHLTKPVHALELRDTLAAVLGRPSVPPEPAPERLGTPTGLPVGPPLRVLLVEDATVNRTVGQLLLDTLGHTVDTATDGQDGLDAAYRASYDVILMDVQMPVLDGLEATRRLRRQPPPGPRPWVIALTANALPEHREQCAAAGMTTTWPSRCTAVTSPTRSPVYRGRKSCRAGYPASSAAGPAPPGRPAGAPAIGRRRPMPRPLSS